MAAPLPPRRFCSFPTALLFGRGRGGSDPMLRCHLGRRACFPCQISGCFGRSPLAGRQAGRQSCLQAGAASPVPAVSQVLGRKESGVRFRKDDFPFCVSSPLEQRLQGPPQPGSAELCSHTLCHPSDSRAQALLAAVPFQAIFYLWHKSQLQRLKTGY